MDNSRTVQAIVVVVCLAAMTSFEQIIIPIIANRKSSVDEAAALSLQNDATNSDYEIRLLNKPLQSWAAFAPCSTFAELLSAFYSDSSIFKICLIASLSITVMTAKLVSSRQNPTLQWRIVAINAFVKLLALIGYLLFTQPKQQDDFAASAKYFRLLCLVLLGLSIGQVQSGLVALLINRRSINFYLYNLQHSVSAELLPAYQHDQATTLHFPIALFLLASSIGPAISGLLLKNVEAKSLDSINGPLSVNRCFSSLPTNQDAAAMFSVNEDYVLGFSIIVHLILLWPLWTYASADEDPPFKLEQWMEPTTEQKKSLTIEDGRVGYSMQHQRSRDKSCSLQQCIAKYRSKEFGGEKQRRKLCRILSGPFTFFLTCLPEGYMIFQMSQNGHLMGSYTFFATTFFLGRLAYVILFSTGNKISFNSALTLSIAGTSFAVCLQNLDIRGRAELASSFYGFSLSLATPTIVLFIFTMTENTLAEPTSHIQILLLNQFLASLFAPIAVLQILNGYGNRMFIVTQLAAIVSLVLVFIYFLNARSNSSWHGKERGGGGFIYHMFSGKGSRRTRRSFRRLIEGVRGSIRRGYGSLRQGRFYRRKTVPEQSYDERIPLRCRTISSTKQQCFAAKSANKSGEVAPCSTPKPKKPTFKSKPAAYRSFSSENILKGALKKTMGKSPLALERQISFYR